MLRSAVPFIFGALFWLAPPSTAPDATSCNSAAAGARPRQYEYSGNAGMAGDTEFSLVCKEAAPHSSLPAVLIRGIRSR